MFITGNGGCGKSHLIRTIYHSDTKTLSNQIMSSGVAAIYNGNTTIVTGLGIPVGYF